MNICIDASPIASPFRSGIHSYTEGLIECMCDYDLLNQYTLLFYSLFRRAYDIQLNYGASFNKTIIRVPDLVFPLRDRIINNVILPTFFKKHNFDIFHKTYGYSVPKHSRCVRIITVHDLRTLAIGDNFYKQNIELYAKSLRRVDCIVAVSNSTKNDIIHFFNILPEKIRVVHLAAEKRYHAIHHKSCIIDIKKFPIHRPYFLSIGSVPRKNIHTVIEAFNLFKFKDSFNLVICCRNNIYYKSHLRQALAQHPNIIFLHNATDVDLLSLYAGCHAFLFPSLYEGFGLPILEAMHCGAPVITSNLSSCPEVGGEAAIYVDPYDSRDIATAMERLVSDSSLRSEMINKGHHRTKFFTRERFYNSMLEVYRHSLSTR